MVSTLNYSLEIVRSFVAGPRVPPSLVDKKYPVEVGLSGHDGWLGITPKPFDYTAPKLAIDAPAARTTTTVLHQAPFIARLDNVLTEAQCAALVDLGQQTATRAWVPSPFSWIPGVISGKQAFYRDGAQHSALLRETHLRLAEVGQFQNDHAAPITLSYRGIGDGFMRHFDWLPEIPDFHTVGSNRTRTIRVCLRAPETGGEAFFPSLNLTIPQKVGSALYYEYGTPDGHHDLCMMNLERRVVAGEAWYAQRLVHDAPLPCYWGNTDATSYATF